MTIDGPSKGRLDLVRLKRLGLHMLVFISYTQLIILMMFNPMFIINLPQSLQIFFSKKGSLGSVNEFIVLFYGPTD